LQGGGRRFESDLLHQSASVLAVFRPEAGFGEVLRDLEKVL
jgi:hypothetical protein